MPPKGGKVNVSAGGGPRLGVRVHIAEDKASPAFKRARKEVNGRMRTAMQTVGERTVLPRARAAFTRDTGKMAGSLFIKKDRAGVFIGSRLRGAENRALGWVDFGGKRPMDSARREGPYVIVRSLEKSRDKVDDEILKELRHIFDPLEFSA